MRRLNTTIDTEWKKVKSHDEDVVYLNSFRHEILKYTNHAACIQSYLPTSIKHGGETRSWKSLSDMFSSILKSRDVLLKELRDRKRENLISRIGVDLLREIVEFLAIFSCLTHLNLPSCLLCRMHF